MVYRPLLEMSHRLDASAYLHMAVMRLLELPDELLLRVLYYLDVPELLAVSRVRR